MGKSGSGKTSMRSVIFSNNPASLTSRFGATIDFEQNHVRFLGDLILNLWDCGGQNAFMDSYLTTQRSTIFKDVGVLIYVLDVESRETEKDIHYYNEVLAAVAKESEGAGVFVLVHKMDLVRGNREVAFDRKKRELLERTKDIPITIFGTSIYDESLYKAWSRIVHTLIPNAAAFSKHLTTFANACSASEVIMFERTTFLVVATSKVQSSAVPVPPPAAEPSDLSLTMDDKRYERTSEIIKEFKYSCSRLREEFHSLELELPEFTAVLDELTKNTYILVVVHDPTIETAAIQMNIRLIRDKFEELQADTS
ncbi:hypothetical protein SISSUDRAFT_1020509 [Sistotremastrum suecicum HHB10207 ss-3]|uniref:GTP-binding protein n=2 Tax=Sistotremastraceae TaxID=3402574 RepID=A0A166E703_9AGAM|nr:hypothetical protein SISSUDRAFT_1020509 [Sistotremastrum suecicum HHB10207 ss-3]